MTTRINRRTFLAYGFAAGALTIAAPLSSNSRANETEEGSDLTPLLKLHADNSAIFYGPSPDMGQGVDTSLAMMFAEELDLDFETLDTKPMPYSIMRGEDGNIVFKAVPQGAGGSTSTPRNWTLLRRAAAVARQLILQAAARRESLPFAELGTHKSHVVTSSGTRIPYGELIEAAANEAMPEGFEPTFKSRADRTLLGTAQKQKVAKDIVTGQPLYGMDMDYDGAKVAMVAHCPYLDGFVEAVDDSAARSVPGVHSVHVLDRPDPAGNYTYLAAGVAVVADSYWAAKRAKDLLDITWNHGPHAGESTESLDAQCTELLTTTGQIVRNDGNFDAAMAGATTRVSHTYRIPTVSHAQLEPQNCFADVRAEGATVIGPFQSPSGASRITATITGLDRLAVEVKYTRLGGGFGRRLTSDHVAEAVTISKAAGVPVRLMWTREDDLAHDFYRPMGHHEMHAGFDAAGNLVAWSQRLAGTPKYYRRDNVEPQNMYQADLYVDDFPAGRVDNLRLEYLMARSGLPQGSWRAPAHTANAFVIQSFLDEIATELGEDPLELRLRLLGADEDLEYGQHGGPVFSTTRLKTVLREAARLANWGKDMPAGSAQGIAGHFTFGGYCALVADVTLLDGGQFKVDRVSGAVDVGTIINRAGILAQMEGGIQDGLSTALAQEIRVSGGRVQTENFDTYTMMRIAESVPQIDVHIVDSTLDPSGMGEMSLPPLAPAVANAVARAGGRRMRAQPFFSESA